MEGSAPPAPRRVLMTADTVGGVWNYCLALAQALQPHGVEVTLATMGQPLSPAQWREAREVANLRVEESKFRLEWMQEPWEDVHRAGHWLLGLAERLGPEVVHLNGYAHAALPWRAPTLVVGHSCVCSWWRAVRGADPPVDWERYRREVGRGLAAASLVVAPTAAMLEALRRHYGRLPEARVVANGRDADGFPPLAKEEFVFSVGRLWDEAKNLEALERCAPLLAWPVQVAGEEKHPDGGRVETRSVRCLGRLGCHDLATWYGRAGIYALPARYEPFGLSALEAALAGCALVLGDIDSLREVWGDAATYVPPTDHPALAGAINDLAANRRRREEMGRRARARALEYTPQRMARAYLEAYAYVQQGGYVGATRR